MNNTGKSILRWVISIVAIIALVIGIFVFRSSKNKEVKVVSVKETKQVKPKTLEELPEVKDYDRNGMNVPDSYVIPATITADNQDGTQCAACSSAYLLRFYGENADGVELYKDYPCKNQDGTIDPRGFKQFFSRYKGYKVDYYRGDTDDLKAAISKGIPQIIFANVDANSSYLHYMPVVGYDKDNFYIQDSLTYTRNSNDSAYNRKVSIADMEKMRDISVDYYNGLFMTVTITNNAK